ncbi:MAG: hypothetical protein KDA63_16730, partial [Planctomycetales bacterium]|nr:hypothetical protein [Planctomycetales bacterium]
TISGDGDVAEVDGAPTGIKRLEVLDGALWGVSDDALYRYVSGDIDIERVYDGAVVDLCLYNGAVYAATADDVFRYDDGELVNVKPVTGWLSSDSTVVMADGTQVLADPVELAPIERIASYCGTLYVLRPGGIALLDGAVFQTEPVDWGMMPSREHRDMLSLGSRLCIATGAGVAELRGAALTMLDGDARLPYEDTTCLAAGFDRDLWIGTTAGAIRQVDGEFHFFGADHWLPSGRVNDIAVDGHAVYIATDGGIGVIRYEPYTLRKKAAFFERDLAARGHQRLGFVHQLYWDGENKQWLREISDNDGGHTAHYLAAMCFKYAATGDESARREAVDAAEAMIWLQRITGSDGFFARSIWANNVDQGKLATQGSGGLPAKWYETDDGLWTWKGDTSSDEVNGHFYAMALFHDLVAQGDEKQLAAGHLERIARHIVENGWVLRDMDGQPTRWGRWDPDYLLTPYGFESRGLNGMEAQAYMWTAAALSGDPLFRQGLAQLLEWRYHTYTVREKLTFPPENVVTWDDELAFRVMHPLLTYCDDPELRSIYLRALARHWEVLRMQKVPFFNFIYGGLTGNDCEAAAAVKHLREWSLDTVSHSYRNSHRADLAAEPGYTPYAGGTRAISPRELSCGWGSRSSIFYDGGNGSRTITPPAGWLEDYWMGRYYGMIAAPTTTDVALLTVPPSAEKPAGAEAYNGPPRPEIGSVE